MQLCQGNWVAVGRVVVYYARAALAFHAGIKCQHRIIKIVGFTLLMACLDPG